MRVTTLLCASFALFGALLVWPLLTIPNRPVLIFGVPALVGYLFLVWAAIVTVLAVVSARGDDDDGPGVG